MGDDADEEKKRQLSTKEFSSGFKNFVGGRIATLYAYDVLLSHGLLESYTGDMPIGAQHSSESTRRTSEPAPGRGDRGGKMANNHVNELVNVLNKPIVLEDTPEQREYSYYATRNMEYKAKRNRAHFLKCEGNLFPSPSLNYSI